MTQQDIIRMAQEAGLHIATDMNWMPIIGLEYAQKFAELARAAEREECMKLCKEHFYAYQAYDAIRARGQA